MGQSVDAGGDPGGPRGDHHAGPLRRGLVLWRTDDSPAEDHDGALSAAAWTRAALRAGAVGVRKARASATHTRFGVCAGDFDDACRDPRR